MKKSELKQLIREVIEEQALEHTAMSKQALEVINFLRNNEDQITRNEKQRQDVRRVWSVYLQDLLTDEDYKKLHPGSNIGKVGGGGGEDFARGT